MCNCVVCVIVLSVLLCCVCHCVVCVIMLCVSLCCVCHCVVCVIVLFAVIPLTGGEFTDADVLLR